MARIFIENLDYQVCIEKYDRAHTLFYLDPPYYDTGGYKYNFERKDFEELKEALSKIKGKFILSLNDLKEVRKIFKGFKFVTLNTKYSICQGEKARSSTRKEVLIKNF